uniref:Protein FAR1-RELATED SEQUENCE n=2 Tax=Triticinae TaxID=1648030 RepID=A0A453P219_AEGTS
MVSDLAMMVNPDPYLEESDGQDIGIPEVGMVFNNHMEVNRFYRRYARRVGFGVSVRRSSFSQEGTCLYLELMCCKGGRPRYEPKFRKRASSTTNCPARIRVKLWGDKLLHVELANLDHNHPVSPAMARFLNSYKQLSGPAKRRLRMGGPGAMPVEEPSKMPVDKLGALEELLFGESKNHKFVERGRLKLQPGDSEALRLFFTRMQAKNANFFNVIDLDDEGCVRNVFWADAWSRAMYEYYNDAITLDTSYVVSKHDMPLVTFLGVNHHGQSVLLGCGLLSDETAETYTWLFKAWVACMSGNLPKAIITDQCRGIQSAVAEVVPGVRHRICLHQIMKKAADQLSGLSEYKAISKALQKAAYDSLTVDEFEGEWSTLITYNGLQGHDWLRSLYECRFSWVPIFLKDAFWAGMSATQRSETITPFFEGYVDLKTSLKQFLGKYVMILQSKYEKEAQADFETFHKQRPPVSKFYMEEQLSNVYTHNMFKKFQDEIEAIMYCHVSLMNGDGPISTFNVKECIFLEDGKRTMSKIFAVTYNTEEKDITCICGGFQFSGILCRHSLSVLKFQQVREVPSQYVLDRWKKDFRQLHVMGRLSSDVVPDNRVDRYDYLSMRCLQLVDSAVLSDKYRLALRLVREVEKFLLNSNTHDDTQPRIKSRIPKVKPNTVTGQNLVNVVTDNGNGGPKGPEASASAQASQIQKGVAEKAVVPAGYIGVPANVQQFMGNQAAMRPSIVYMVPSGVDPQAFGNGVLMPVMYQQMFQIPQQPNGAAQDTLANGKRKRPRAQKPTETSHQSNGTSGPAAG